MSKLSEIFKNIINKFKSLSLFRKIALGVIVLGVIIFIISFIAYRQSNKYGLLFSDLSVEDGQTIPAQLKTDKVDYIIKGNSIYVPKNKVDSLRLQYASKLSDDSKGYELLDNSNSFGMTDDEFQVQKQRAIQGEIEKTIKSFPQVENARVLITPAEESAFVKETKPAKASVYIQLKTGQTLTKGNVKSIIALVSGSVENLPKENVEVVDNNLNLLSQGIENSSSSTGTGTDSSSSVEKQQSIESKFEQGREKAIMDLIEPVVGKDKVQVKVNANLDFDAKQNTTITYDPNKVEASTQTTKETSKDGSATSSSSPVDNNMTNTTTTTNGGNGESSSESQTVNYKNGKSQTKTVTAPGEIKRITASVVVNGTLPQNTLNSLNTLVQGAIGYDPARGDSVNVVSMPFDTTAQKQAQAQLKAMQAEEQQKQRTALYRNIAIAAVALIAGIVALIIFLIKRRKDKEDEYEEGENIDVVIGDEVEAKEPIAYEPLDLEPKNENAHVESEIKKYATEKPDQVTDIIKSWLSEDER
ncbi:flagellar basal-body MS-ring/collar protein FliF [Clostridium oryzae]|uniref:Flagellar M-ring protein n=1 Tax=Clostridium oryzae TaxID=1450648 RepID=A0A1V4ITP6_9CLOT|nr:flagellar basal-body MS-ring/collar protein FliF [Clostridium oryzae]OPJ63279.1 flagellar M-ring protein [Clostridium oryzae]